MWQSSSGADDFEAKFGLLPLMFGTLKGTLYAMLVAVPLALLGAIYTSMFMHPNLRAKIKPTIEIMAALPTVILGFLAGLWLAPVLERIFPAHDRHDRGRARKRRSRGDSLAISPCLQSFAVFALGWNRLS